MTRAVAEGGGGGDQAGTGMNDDILDEEDPMTESEIKEQEAHVKIEIAEAAQAAKMRGKMPAVLQDSSPTSSSRRRRGTTFWNGS